MPDYVLPALTRAAADPEEIVRCAVAAAIAQLAETSQRFLEVAQWMRVVSLRREASGARAAAAAAAASGGRERKDSSAATLQSFDSELTDLQEQVFRIVMKLIMDPLTTAAVKRALLVDITRLCLFMQRKQTNDQLLPLLISFFNDRETSLRVALLESIAGVCAFLGPESLELFVMPCILQVSRAPNPPTHP